MRCVVRTQGFDDPDAVVLPAVPAGEEARKDLALTMKTTAATLYKERKHRSALKCYGFCHTLDPSNMVFRLNAAGACVCACVCRSVCDEGGE